MEVAQTKVRAQSIFPTDFGRSQTGLSGQPVGHVLYIKISPKQWVLWKSDYKLGTHETRITGMSLSYYNPLHHLLKSNCCYRSGPFFSSRSCRSGGLTLVTEGSRSPQYCAMWSGENGGHNTTLRWPTLCIWSSGTFSQCVLQPKIHRG